MKKRRIIGVGICRSRNMVNRNLDRKTTNYIIGIGHLCMLSFARIFMGFSVGRRTAWIRNTESRELRHLEGI